MSNINKVNVNGVEYDIQDKKTLDYLNQQLDYIYDKDEVDTKIKEATQNKASTEYVDNALSNIDLSNYYNKEETDNKIDEALGDIKTFEEMGIYKIKLPNAWPNGNSFITKDTEGATELFAKINEIQNSDTTNKYYPFLILVEFMGTSILFKSLANSYNQFRFISETFSYNDNGQSGSNATDNSMRLYMYVRNGVSELQLQIDQYNSFHITAKNTKYYAVTDNYNPAHKQYVDDSINTAIGDINTILDNINGEVI